MSHQALLQLEHAGTVLALVGPLLLVDHEVPLHVTESVVLLVTCRALVALGLATVFLGVQAADKVIVRKILAHDDEFIGVFIQTVLGKIQHNVIIWDNFLFSGFFVHFFG